MSKNKIQTGEQITNPTLGELEEQKTVTLKTHPNRECLVCGQQWATDDALMLPVNAVLPLQMSLCHVHETTSAVHLVAVDQEKSPKHLSGQVIPEQVVRTGNHAELSDKMFCSLFEMAVPAQRVVFVNDEVVAKLKTLQDDLKTVAKGAGDAG